MQAMITAFLRSILTFSHSDSECDSDPSDDINFSFYTCKSSFTYVATPPPGFFLPVMRFCRKSL